MQEYEDLTRKYELLEEDYVVIKAQTVMEKEQIEGYDPTFCLKLSNTCQPTVGHSTMHISYYNLQYACISSFGKKNVSIRKHADHATSK